VSSVEFKVRQRRWLLGWSALSFALGIGAAVNAVTGAHFLRGDVTVMFIAWGGLAGPYLLDLATGRTVVTDTGISTRSLFRRRSCSWDQVKSVHVSVSRGRGGSSSWIVLYQVIGRPITLRAPFTTREGQDRYFDEALALVKRRKTYRAPRSKR
jgi:hypothetical protein